MKNVSIRIKNVNFLKSEEHFSFEVLRQMAEC